MISDRFAGDHKCKVFFWVVCGIAAFVAFAVVAGWLVQVLWNATIAETFGVNAISFWQAVGLFVLAKIFFGFGGSGAPQRKRQRRRKGRSADQRADVAEAPDDETFRRYWQERGREAYAAFLAERRRGEDVGDGG